MNAAQSLVNCLENEGVEYIFGIPGEENIAVMDALLDSRIRFVTTRRYGGEPTRSAVSATADSRFGCTRASEVLVDIGMCAELCSTIDR